MPYLEQTERPLLVSSEILLGIEEAARTLGIDLEPSLRELGVDGTLLRAPSGYLEHARVTRLLQEIAERFHCNYFGFLVGMYQPPMQMGLLWQAMRLSPTLGEAIRHGVQYHPTFSEGSKHALFTEQGVARVTRWDRGSYPHRTTQMRMLGIVMLFKALQALGCAGWQPSHIAYTFREPQHARQMALFFGCPVLFEQETDSIYFPQRVLARPLANADPQQLETTLQQLDSALAGRATEAQLVEAVTNFILIHLGSRRCTMEGCAQYLGIHVRKLQRGLESSHANFRDLLLEVRMKSARQYLGDSTISLAELSNLLGYQNQSAFSRAFKLQHGESPAQWREHYIRSLD